MWIQEFACNGTLVEDEELGECIQLQGDHRVKVQQFLITGGYPACACPWYFLTVSPEGIATKDQVKLHGF